MTPYATDMLNHIADRGYDLVGRLDELAGERRPVSVTTYETTVEGRSLRSKARAIVVACSDGTVFEYSPQLRAWTQVIPSIPGTPAGKEGG